jgi:hypothetical protein
MITAGSPLPPVSSQLIVECPSIDTQLHRRSLLVAAVAFEGRQDNVLFDLFQGPPFVVGRVVDVGQDTFWTHQCLKVPGTEQIALGKQASALENRL